MSWSWHTEPLDHKQKCMHCQQLLRIGGLVARWTDSELYHVGCLLDRLAAYHKPPEKIWPSADCGSWGAGQVLGGVP